MKYLIGYLSGIGGGGRTTITTDREINIDDVVEIEAMIEKNMEIKKVIVIGISKLTK